MILYKYVGFETGLEILKTKTLGFTFPSDFNDPFEITALALNEHDKGVGIRNRVVNKYAILCLTRAPLNPLMWAHYANSHKGMVIGIDTEKAGLECEESYLIPAQRGEVIYVNTLPKNINSMRGAEKLGEAGSDFDVSWGLDERLIKHTFLYKQLCWAYEEEVRIVKKLGETFNIYRVTEDRELNINEEIWEQKYIHSQPLFLKEISSDSFVEVYVGVNSYVDQLRKNTDIGNTMQALNIHRLKNLCLERGIKLHSVYSDIDSWTLRSKLIES